MARLWPPKTGFSQIAADEGHSVADDRRPVAPPVHTATSSSSPSPGLSKAMHSQRSDSGMTGESTMSGTSLDGDICAHIPYSERTGLNVPGFSQCSSCSTGLYVPVSILSHTNSFLVDTGSSATIISYKLWSAVAPGTSLRPAPQLVSVTNSVLNVVGVVELPLVIGSFSAVHCVYVAKDLKPPCILGRDFLCRHNCVLDLSSSPCSLSISGTTVLLASTPFVKPPVGAVRVSLKDTTIIPPYHEMVCPASIPDAVSHVPAYSYGVVEGLHTFTSKSSVDVACVIARSVDGVVPVRLANFGPSSLTVYAGTHVAEFEPSDSSDVHVVHDNPTDPSCVVCSVGDVSTASLDSSYVNNLLASSNCDLSVAQRDQLEQLLLQYRHLFCPTGDFQPTTNLVSHSIETGSTSPIRQAPRRVSPHLFGTVTAELDKMLDAGVIQPSSSPWASPVVLVSKKGGGIRFCIDYRKLNAVTVRDAHPIPRIDDTLDCLAGAKVFSTLDLKSGYWQIPMAEEDKSKTAFTTRAGLYEFNVMPFGLTNAPATFQRLMHMVLAGLEWETCLAYMDDINVFASSFEQHLDRLSEVFRRLSSAGLTLNAAKCKLLCSSVTYLGHVISADGVSTDPGKTAAISDWVPPSTSKGVSSFLGLASYYRRFVPDFASVAAPLFQLTRRGKKFHWSSDCQHAFDRLKCLLTASPILAYPDFSRPFLLDTDASDFGIGAVLSQVHDDGKEHVVGYASHSLSKAERNYTTTRKELLAVVTFVQHFRHYLLHRPFTLHTDHGSLQWLHNFKEPTGQLARWIERLADYNFTIQHRAGSRHRNADALSRSGEATTTPEPSVSASPVVATVEPVTIDPEPPVADPELDITAPAHSWMPPWTTAEVRTAQTAHPVLAYLIDCLEHTSQPQADHSSLVGIAREFHELLAEFPRLELHNSLLFRCFTDAHNNTSHLQLVVPPSLQQAILDTSHSHATGGHLGSARMKSRIATTFYWPGWRSAVHQFCKQCAICARRKTPPSKRSPMQSTYSGYPWERIAIDLMGPLPTTARGSRYILVCADYFTKWTEALPLPDMTAATVASAIYDHVICRFGVPTMIHSDQGRQFESQLFKELCRVLGAKKTRTTPYRPQSDGMVERFNRTLQAMLSSFVNARQDDWDLHLPSVMFAYRSTEHSGTGYSPYYLMFGREAQLPAAAMFPIPHHRYSPVQYVATREHAMHNAYDLARQRLQGNQRRQKALYDRKSADNTYKVPDAVWLHQPAVPPGTSPKFHRPWDGPYRILEKLSPVVVRLQHCSRPAKQPIVHVDRLKPCAVDFPCPPLPVAAPLPVPPIRPPYHPAENLQFMPPVPDYIPVLPQPVAPAVQQAMPVPLVHPPQPAPAAGARPPRAVHRPAWHQHYHFY